MNRTVKELVTSMRMTIVLVILLCGTYPFLVWAVSQLVFPLQAKGSLVTQDGTIAGSSLIARDFKGAEYFHPRPSRAVQGYDGASSGGSNLGPLSRRLAEETRDRVQAYRRENGLTVDASVPADGVTASASGLDPHITIANARIQAGRVARARAMDVTRVHALIDRWREGRDLWILGEERVNVLLLNLALDKKG